MEWLIECPAKECINTAAALETAPLSVLARGLTINRSVRLAFTWTRGRVTATTPVRKTLIRFRGNDNGLSLNLGPLA